MHIPDGFLSPPVAAATAAAAAGGLLAAARLSKAALAERRLPVLGMTAAFIFAAQMVNFPIPGSTSGHLIGGTLAAAILGPAPAVLAMSVVLVIQTFLFQDGGITALGANVFNEALLGVLVGWLAYRLLARVRPGPAAIATAAWLGVVVPALAAGLELAWSGTMPLLPALAAMGGWHVLIGVGEALITVSIVGYLERVRPSLLSGEVVRRAA